MKRREIEERVEKRKNKNGKLALAALAAAMVIGIAGFTSTFARNGQSQSSEEETALKIALLDAGITEDSIYNLSFEKEGKDLLEVVFYHEGTEYDYKIHSRLGEVIEKEIDQSRKSSLASKAQEKDLLTWEEILAIVSKDSQVALDAMEHSDLSLGREDGVYYYEVEFHKDGREFEYTLRADDGYIVEKEIEKDHKEESREGKDSENFISAEEAKKIAADRMGLAIEKIHFDEITLEHDDKIPHWEIDAKANGKEFDIEVHAVNKEVLQFEVDDDDVKNHDKTDGDYLSAEDAKEIFAKKIGIAPEQIRFDEVELDKDDSVPMWEIEAFANNLEYDVDIHAISGGFISFEEEKMDKDDRDDKEEKPQDQNTNSTKDSSSPTQTQVQTTVASTKAVQYLSADEAKAIAGKHANVSIQNARFDDVELDKDDGIVSWELEFYVDGIEYEFDIDAISGKIWKFEKEQKKTAAPVQTTKAPAPTTVATTVAPTRTQATTTTPAPTTTARPTTVATSPAPTTTQAPAPTQTASTTRRSEFISAEQAKNIALRHAGVSAQNAYFDDVEFDEDDGYYVWEIEFEANGYEYEYEINARTGAIIEFDKEWDD